MSKTKQPGLTVPALIRAIRDHAGLTQVALGERLGVSQGVVSDWELGRRPGTLVETVTKIADACGVSVCYQADGWRIVPS